MILLRTWLSISYRLDPQHAIVGYLLKLRLARLVGPLDQLAQKPKIGILVGKVARVTLTDNQFDNSAR